MELGNVLALLYVSAMTDVYSHPQNDDKTGKSEKKRQKKKTKTKNKLDPISKRVTL